MSRAAVDGGHAEEVLEAVVGGEGVALHVEEDVARRRGREEAEAQPVLDGLDELVADDARPPLLQLEAGLGTEALGHGSLDAGHGRGPGGGGQGGDGRQPGGGELAGLAAPHAGDQGEVVLAAAAVVADLGPPADAAVGDGPGVGVVGDGVHGGFEGGFDPPVVGGEVGQAVAAGGEVAPYHVDLLRGGTLDALDVAGVRAGLEDGGGLDPAGQLGVAHLVAPGPPDARRVDPEEEVGMAPPAAVEERGLVDHLRAMAATVAASPAARPASPGSGRLSSTTWRPSARSWAR